MNSTFSMRYLLVGLLIGGIGVAAYFGINAWLGDKPKPTSAPQIGEAIVRANAEVPPPEVRFTDVTEKAGIRFKHFNGAAGKKLLPETMGAGVAVLDFDGDNKPDLVFVNSSPWPGHAAAEGGSKLALYRNKGDGTFEDATEKAGLAIAMYGIGAAVGDIDNDGKPDLFITGVGGNRLFHNVGGKFDDITASAGLGDKPIWPEVNADNWYKWNTPIPFGSSATFVDYDGDARLDLFVCYYINWSPAKDLSINAQLTGVGRAYVPPTQFEGAYCALYRNIDGQHFEDVSEKAGVRVVEREGLDANARQRAVGKSLGVIVCDPDDDGWPDLIVANDTVRNFFFHNEPVEGGGRTFKEKGIAANVAYAEGRPRGAMGIDWGEYRPGKHAAVIANFANEPSTFLGLTTQKQLHFSDHALSVGLTGPSRGPLKFGTFFFDYDLDGRQDLFSANGHLEPEIGKVQQGQTYAQPLQLFWNTGGEQRLFEPVTPKEAGDDLFKPLVGRGCAYLDYDSDGDLDIVVTENGGSARLLRNDSKLGNHWLRLTLVGDGKRSARDAVGAVVTFEAGGMVQKRYVVGSRGYLSQSERPLTFGLGKTAKIDRVTVRWPGKDAGAPQEWKDIDVDRAHELRQGDPKAPSR